MSNENTINVTPESADPNTLSLSFDVVPEVPETPPATSPAPPQNTGMVIQPQSAAFSNTAVATPPATQSSFPVLKIGSLDKTQINDKSVILAPLGTTVSRTPIEKVKFSSNKRELISILTQDIIAMKTHWCKELGGNIQCFGGKCCEDNDFPSVRYILPCIVYDTDKTGTKVLSYQWTLKGLVLADGKPYEKINTVAELLTVQGLNITDIDILCTCLEEKYQDVDYQNAGPAKWRTNKTMAEAIIKEFNAKSKFLPLILGRKVTEDIYRKKMNATEAVQPYFEPQSQETTAAFNTAFNTK